MKEQNLYDPLYAPPTVRPNSVLLVLFNLQRVQFWDTVSKYLDDNYWITNRKAREVTGVSDILKMSRLLKVWVEKRLLEKVGQAKKDSYYKKPGQIVPKSLLSEGLKIKHQ